MVLQSYIPYFGTWVVREAFVKLLSLVVTGCVLNQSWGHCLLRDAL